jgi:hypothetical protein
MAPKRPGTPGKAFLRRSTNDRLEVQLPVCRRTCATGMLREAQCTRGDCGFDTHASKGWGVSGYGRCCHRFSCERHLAYFIGCVFLLLVLTASRTSFAFLCLYHHGMAWDNAVMPWFAAEFVELVYHYRMERRY